MKCIWLTTSCLFYQLIDWYHAEVCLYVCQQCAMWCHLCISHRRTISFKSQSSRERHFLLKYMFFMFYLFSLSLFIYCSFWHLKNLHDFTGWILHNSTNGKDCRSVNDLIVELCKLEVRVQLNSFTNQHQNVRIVQENTKHLQFERAVKKNALNGTQIEIGLTF